MTARSRYLSAAVTLLVAVFLAVAVVGDLGGGTVPPRATSVVTVPTPPSASTADETSALGCDRFAAPRGFDHGHARGTLARPYRSVKRLARSLRRGQTGCVQPGRYSHREVAHLRSPGATLRGIGRRRPLVLDPIWIEPSAVGASIRNLRLTSLDRVYTVPLKVQADRARIAGNRIFGGSNESCVLVGSQNRVSGVTIERNVIHNCGRSGKFDHLLYIEDALRTRIRWNLLLANHGGWAVHLYPNADDSLIEHNVIDGNFGGVVIAGYGDATSNGNLIRANAITYSGPRRNVEASWEGYFGSDNLVTANCLFSQSADAPSGIGERWGFTVGSNAVIGGSPYVDRADGDYRFHSRSPCGGLVGYVADAVSAGLR
jgi:nitrous oxidase accessory protein NosD